jgi:hypothetical protein
VCAQKKADGDLNCLTFISNSAELISQPGCDCEDNRPASFRSMSSSTIEVPPFDADDPADGIFHRLNAIAKGNPASANLVKVIPSDQICDAFANVIMPNWRQHWFSFHPNPFITFDFRPRSVRVLRYSLRTYSGGVGYGHLRSWVLEGSNDAQAFLVLDDRRDCDALNGNGLEAVFQIEHPEPFQVLRLRLTGPNHAGSDFLVLRGIEFCGSFI